MKKGVLQVLFFILALAGAFNAHATHLFGGELQYESLGGNTYKVILTMYGDCSGENFSRLVDAAPAIEIYDGNLMKQTIILSAESGMGIEVSPVCPDEINNTSCKGGTLPGVKKFIYANTVTLTHTSASWRFIFQGIMGNNSYAGRSNSVTNVTPSSVMYLEAMLNNLGGNNSSPKYSTIPTPFYCINIEQQYNQGAIDNDNDSLAFALSPALITNGQTTGYLGSYTATTPMATSYFNFNTINGQMSFKPNLLQKSVVVNVVEEYRNGVLVGTSMREMTIIILDNCSNRPPSANFNNAILKGGIHIGNNIINICEGVKEITFTMPVNDADGDLISATLNNMPAGASGNIINNNTTNPVIDFKWDISTVPVGTYNLYLNLKDDNCPLSSSQTMALTIQIFKAVTASHEVINPTRCLYDARVRLILKHGTFPRVVTIIQNGSAIKKYNDTTGIIEDLFKPGDYHVFINSVSLLCNTEYDFTVVDSGSYPFSPIFESPHYCINDTVRPIEITSGRYGTLKWYDMEGVEMDKPPVISTAKAGVFSWLVSELYKECESVRDTFRVYVHPQPEVEILTIPERVCTGDKIYLEAKEGLQYEWLPKDIVYRERDSSVYTRVMAPTTYYAIGADEYGCKDTSDITYSDIEACCRFSYPTAFTPNGDGKNDGFRAIMYGNAERYEMVIFNRWGQEVFRTKDPKEYWNGSFGGQPCEIGTYFYMVRGKCMTGGIEDHKGEFILIR